MQIRIKYQSPELSIDEIISGTNADAVVAEVKRRAAAEAGFATRILINSLSPLIFAQQVVSRYNESLGKSVPVPRSCEEFLRLGVSEGIVIILEP